MNVGVIPLEYKLVYIEMVANIVFTPNTIQNAVTIICNVTPM